MRVLDSAQMNAFDRYLIEEIGMPVSVLMENAAQGVVSSVVREFPDCSHIAVVAGPGHNGADAIAVARLWVTRGGSARVAIACERQRLSAGVERQLVALEAIGAQLVLPIRIGGRAQEIAAFLADCPGRSILVDGLFGTGLDRPLEGHYAELVSLLATLDLPRVAIDLPSGLRGGRAEAFGPHLSADLTVTFVAPKVAHVLSPSDQICGQVDRVDLGVPGSLLEPFLSGASRRPGQPPALFLDLACELAPHLGRRSRVSHKGSYGHVLVVGGSLGKSGAVLLATRGALRAGAGLVTAAVPAALLTDLEAGSAESMTVALEEGRSGHVGEAAVAQVLEVAESKSVVVLGPGLDVSAAAADLVRTVVRQVDLPLVIDADGLNNLEGDLSLLEERSAPTILTPHPGEMARLLGQSVAEVQADRLAACRRAARESGSVVVLKGHQTLVATPRGDVFVERVGNPGMATGGTGDVLAGLCGGLLAQRSDPSSQGIDGTALTVRLAVHLHGLAGDLASSAKGEESLLAGDLAEWIPAAFERLGNAVSGPTICERALERSVT